MPQFAEQLITARKAKSMTQEQLAKAVHISRSRVSRWETGGAVPDLEMLLKLSQVLECDLLPHMQSEAEHKDVPETVADEVSTEPEGETDTETPRAAKNRRLLMVLGAVVVAVLLLFLLTGKKPPAEVYEPYTKEWYQLTDAVVKNQAYVTITPTENPTRAIRFDDFAGGVGWFFTFTFAENNGVDFTITRIIQTVFNLTGKDDIVFEGDELAAVGRAVTLHKGMPQPVDWSGGFPLQNVSGVGVALEGVDANGNELTFRGYVELSQEIAE